MQALQQDQVQQGQEWRILTMFVLKESKASVTELFTVADARDVAIKCSIQCRSNAEFSALRTTLTYY